MIRHAFPKEHSGCRVSEGATGNTGTPGGVGSGLERHLGCGWNEGKGGFESVASVWGLAYGRWAVPATGKGNSRRRQSVGGQGRSVTSDGWEEL